MYEKDFPDDFPKKNKKRGDRKAKQNHLKNKMKNLARMVFSIPEENIQQWSNRHFESLNCNCWMCKNPRRVFKGDDTLTMQERKQNESENID
jgi:hypothetical protein